MWFTVLLPFFVCFSAIGEQRGPCSELQVNEICVGKIVTKFLKSEKACIEKLRVQKLQSDDTNYGNVCAREVKTKHICSDEASIGSGYVGNLGTDVMCANETSTNMLCVAGNIVHETKYKAHAAYTANVPYILNSKLDFDTIIDDPNGNMVTGPTRYTVPVTGYYLITLGVSIVNITGAEVITGIPSSRLAVYVNNVVYLKAFENFMNFGMLQSNIVTGLVHLNAGDILDFAYSLIVLDPLTGQKEYVGTATINAGPGSTFVTIHYLSSDFGSVICRPCDVAPQPCTTMCQPSCDIICEHPTEPPCDPPCRSVVD
jgi:hypothetical protein